MSDHRGGGGALGVNADLSTLVFSDTVLKDQRIGGPVALSDDRMVIIKVPYAFSYKEEARIYQKLVSGAPAFQSSDVAAA